MNLIKRPVQTSRFTVAMVAASLAALAPLGAVNAQTCVGTIRPSNPSSVYVIDTANGLVTDTRTGLMWDRCPSGLFGAGCTVGTYTTATWVGALNLAVSYNTSSYKGYADWRVPNFKELRSLVEECAASPSINDVVFPNTPLAFFWSVSPDVNGVANSMAVYFGSGEGVARTRTTAQVIRMVRAGQ